MSDAPPKLRVEDDPKPEEAAETEATRRGCHHAFLQTHSYQAPAFT